MSYIQSPRHTELPSVNSWNTDKLSTKEPTNSAATLIKAGNQGRRAAIEIRRTRRPHASSFPSLPPRLFAMPSIVTERGCLPSRSTNWLYISKESICNYLCYSLFDDHYDSSNLAIVRSRWCWEYSRNIRLQSTRIYFRWTGGLFIDEGQRTSIAISPRQGR
jgi:hypothetical protein